MLEKLVALKAKKQGIEYHLFLNLSPLLILNLSLKYPAGRHHS